MVENSYIDSIRDKDKEYGHKHEKGEWKHMYHMYDYPMMGHMVSPMMTCPMMHMGCPFMQGMMGPMMTQYPMTQYPTTQYPAMQYPMAQAPGMAQTPIAGYPGTPGMTGYPSGYPYGYSPMGTKRDEEIEE